MFLIFLCHGIHTEKLLNLLLQFGLVGHFWFAAGMTIQLYLFAIVVAEIRIKAPGAKTFLQVKYIIPYYFVYRI